jgi:AAA domain/PLD-like domain
LTTLLAGRAFALAKFAFWIQVERSHGPFRSMRRIEDCDNGLCAYQGRFSIEIGCIYARAVSRAFLYNSQPMPRPLFRKTGDELHQLFEKWKNSARQLEVLVDELSRRTRPKAIALRKRVEMALRQLKEASTKHVESDELSLFDGESEGQPKTSKTDDEAEALDEPRPDYFSPPEKFTLVEPMGVKGRPAAFKPVLDNDVRLAVELNDSSIKLFRAALFELIREMRRRRIGNQQFTLEDGERLKADTGFSYQFEFTEEANLFEGAKVEIIVGGQVVPGHLTGLLRGRIIVTLQSDFGPTIQICVLRIDATALLQAMHDRLQKIERREVPAFRAEFAENAIRNVGEAKSPVPILHWPWKQNPNNRQRQFVSMALANEVSWLWGPPGTGKTNTLSALTRLLYESGKRILICSNTNQAVDQLLLQLCIKMRDAGEEALKEGRIVRLGRIEHEKLQQHFAEFISVESIIANKSEGLIQRKSELESQLERIGREVALAEGTLRRFARLDELQSRSTTAQHELSVLIAKCDHPIARVREAKEREAKLAQELRDRSHAGFFRQLVMRAEAVIRQDLAATQSRITALGEHVIEETRRKDAKRAACAELAKAVQEATTALAEQDRSHWQQVAADYERRRQPLRDELALIAAKLEEIQNSVLREARIVGATVTRTYLRPAEFVGFDTVIVDEASMILLPAVFHTIGLARERAVVAGDFQQLPPIVQTEQQAIHDVLAKDVFENAGININTVRQGEVPRLVMLNKQFRMDDKICRIVSGAFYGGLLTTALNREAGDSLKFPDPFNQRLTIIDTSDVWPFATRDAFNSRFNLMHALAIRNLALHLHDKGLEAEAMVGVASPYSAQAKLLRKMLKAHGLDEKNLRASSVHGFQGDERNVFILDLVDSVGERNAGFFLQANHLRHSGAKLFNVALSRAQEAIIIIANLTFLDAKLPGDAILRGLLHDVQGLGRVVDVRDVLSLYPIVEDLKRFGPQPDLDPEAVRTGLFGGRDFARLVKIDLAEAKKSIVIFSGFITPTRASQMGDLLRRKIAEGVRVRCVTRPPRYNGNIPEELGREALKSLEGIGAAIDLRNHIHEKVVLIDHRIAWFGSLNPLSHTIRTSELMARIENEEVADQVARMLSARRRSKEDLKAASGAVAENPRCEKCGGWTVLY